MAIALRFELRPRVPWSIAVAAPFGAVAFALLACAGLVVWAGAPVGKAYVLLFEGAFGSRFAITETLTRATPLMLTGLAAAVAFRATAAVAVPIPPRAANVVKSARRGVPLGEAFGAGGTG